MSDPHSKAPPLPPEDTVLASRRLVPRSGVLRRAVPHRTVTSLMVSAILAAVATCGRPGPTPASAADLIGPARELAARQVERMGPGYGAHIDPERHVVYVSALDDEHLRRTELLVTAYIDAQKRTLFDRPLPWNLLVLLPTSDDYRELASEAGLEKAAGFCAAGGRKLVSIDRGTVLIHELTHALHFADTAEERQVHPIWVKEGLATLFQYSRITPAGLLPHVDASVVTVQRAARKGELIPLSELVRMSKKDFMGQAELCYPQARYVMFYLHERQRLRDWYTGYKRTYTRDPTGRRALEAALGKGLGQIEPEWREWVAELSPPADPARGRQARLGIEVVNHRRGVEVVGLVPGSPAAEAGRIRVGDVVCRLDGHDTPNTAAYVAAVRATGANRTVKVEILRRGHRRTVIQPLGAPQE